MDYIKCDKCEKTVKTQEDFKKLLENGEWFIGHNGLHWDYEHKCNN
jgi:hypothetical protein